MDNQGGSNDMIWTVPTLVQFLPKYHRISMEERFARAYALCTTYMCCSMWIDMQIDTQLVRLIFHQYSRTHEMNRWTDEVNSSNPHAILVKIPCDFKGGEICTSVGTLHNIHVIPWILSLYDWISPILNRLSPTGEWFECMRLSRWADFLLKMALPSIDRLVL
jgi:hypothetical protein